MTPELSSFSFLVLIVSSQKETNQGLVYTCLCIGAVSEARKLIDN
jgi:hypothetical protein